MSSPAAYDSFHDRLTAAWVYTDLIFENTDYETPVDGDGKAMPFVYVEIFGDRYPQISVGAPQQNLFEESGICYCHVMVPSGSGSRDARVHANNILNLFREQNTAGVRIDDMSIGEGQPGRSFPNYWAMTVTLWWERYDITDLT
jgi:hypothetical protein